eukprot:4042391-Alexandrium_andersonii.AAC.1
MAHLKGVSASLMYRGTCGRPTSHCPGACLAPRRESSMPPRRRWSKKASLDALRSKLMMVLGAGA